MNDKPVKYWEIHGSRLDEGDVVTISHDGASYTFKAVDTDGDSFPASDGDGGYEEAYHSWLVFHYIGAQPLPDTAIVVDLLEEAANAETVIPRYKEVENAG